jgi:hypothetical protein
MANRTLEKPTRSTFLKLLETARTERIAAQMKIARQQHNEYWKKYADALRVVLMARGLMQSIKVFAAKFLRETGMQSRDLATIGDILSGHYTLYSNYVPKPDSPVGEDIIDMIGAPPPDIDSGEGRQLIENMVDTEYGIARQAIMILDPLTADGAMRIIDDFKVGETH